MADAADNNVQVPQDRRARVILFTFLVFVIARVTVLLIISHRIIGPRFMEIEPITTP